VLEETVAANAEVARQKIVAIAIAVLIVNLDLDCDV
jgi:hypothetical protein